MVRYATHDGYDVGSNPAGINKLFLFLMMIIKNSKQFRIFNGNGIDLEKLYLLTFVNKYKTLHSL